MEFDAGDAAGMVAGGFARRLFCVVLAMLLETSEGEVEVKVKLRKLNSKQTRREKIEAKTIRVFVIGLDDNRKLIGYCLPRKFRHTLGILPATRLDYS